jgi:hypothetical protein
MDPSSPANPDDSNYTDPSLNLRRWAPSLEPFAEWIDGQNFAQAKLWASELRGGTEEQVEGRVAEEIAWDYCFNSASRTQSQSLGARSHLQNGHPLQQHLSAWHGQALHR